MSPTEEVTAMCHEMWMHRRRRREQEEVSRDMWLDFERTRPVSDPQAPPEREEEIRLESEPVLDAER